MVIYITERRYTYIMASANPTEFSTPDGLTKKLNGLTRWFTNLDVAKRHEKLILWKKYTP